MKAEFKKITDKISQLTFESKEEMNETFVRITGYLECPKFKDQIFTLGQYREWYSTEYGSWSYYTDWSGHNIPSKGLVPFINGMFDPLSELEHSLIDTFKYKVHPHYIIAIYDGVRDGALDHEMAHALYGTEPEYTEAVDIAVKGNWLALEDVRNKLTELGYNPDTHIDECHAYVGVDHAWLDDKGVEYPLPLSIALRDLYDKYKPLTGIQF